MHYRKHFVHHPCGERWLSSLFAVAAESKPHAQLASISVTGKRFGNDRSLLQYYTFAIISTHMREEIERWYGLGSNMCRDMCTCEGMRIELEAQSRFEER